MFHRPITRPLADPRPTPREFAAAVAVASRVATVDDVPEAARRVLFASHESAAFDDACAAQLAEDAVALWHRSRSRVVTGPSLIVMEELGPALAPEEWDAVVAQLRSAR